MSDLNWDQIYTEKQMAQYPDTELIRFVARNYYNVPDRKEIKFLDVGCGAGASAWYLAREGFSVAAIDKSLVAFTRTKEKLDKDNLEAFIACMDITKLEFKPDYFDCIIDISSLCYVSRDDINSVMKQLYKVLKPEGKIFSLTPARTCSRKPFTNFVDDVKLEVRFMDNLEVRDQFKVFKNIKIAPYNYGDEWNRINLWSTMAEK